MYTIIHETGTVTRDSDGVVIAPCHSADDPNFVEYIQWVEAGNQPTVGTYVEEPSAVPATVTPRQIRLALSAVGLRSAVEQAVQASSLEIKDTWEFSTEFERSNPLINAMAESLGQTPEQVDALFNLAATL